MGFSASLPQFRSLLAVPFLAMALAFPANAETSPNGPAAATTPGATAPVTAPEGQTTPSSAGTSATSPSVAPATSSQNTPPKPSPSSPGTSATSPSATPSTSGQNTPPTASPSTSPTQGAAPQGGQKAATPSAPANGSATKPEAAEATPSAVPEKPKSSIVINIDKSAQEMTVFVDGVELYSWPVSTGMRGYSTPSGTYTASSMNKIWYSKQWDNAPMPNAVFFTKEGHAIHGTLEEKNLGKPASHGCVRLSRQNAATLYALVEANGLPQTQVVLTGVTAGGEGPKVASPGRWPEDMATAFRHGSDRATAISRGKRSSAACSDGGSSHGPQGYYAPPRDRYYPPRGAPRY